MGSYTLYLAGCEYKMIEILEMFVSQNYNI